MRTYTGANRYRAEVIVNGAESLLETLIASGIEVCFANPGTSEMHLLAALDGKPAMRGVLTLFEGVATGAADGYARMAGKPACTLLHLGPGLANGLANLHNARRAHSPIVNIVGDHATYHRPLDAPLSSDIDGFAQPVSGWVHTAVSSERVAADGAAAVRAAHGPPGQVATLILPTDVAWGSPGSECQSQPPDDLRPVNSNVIDDAARALNSGERCALLLNGLAAGESGLHAAGRISAHTGAELWGDTFIARIAGGAGRPTVRRVPYFPEQAEEALVGIRHLILVEARPPASFFAYQGRASELTPQGAHIHQLTSPGDNTVAALEALAEAIGAAAEKLVLADLERPGLPQGTLDPRSVAQSLGAQLPEDAIVVNEAASSGFALPKFLATAAPHDTLELTGGAIGMGLPVAAGAAIACPDRRVVAAQADGSAMYTLQSLWTMAREQLDVTTILFSNRKYAILQVEFMRIGGHNPGVKAMDMMDLSRPDLDWVKIAQGLGVPALQAKDAETFNDALGRSFAAPGPFLIEAII